MKLKEKIKILETIQYNQGTIQYNLVLSALDKQGLSGKTNCSFSNG